MLKKALIVLAALAGLYGAFCVGRYVASSGGISASDVEAAKEAAKAAGMVEGRRSTLASGQRWHCIHAETPMDGNQMMFCSNNSAARDSMCEQAKANASSDPALTIIGCPDGTYIADE